jgi:hypothetical protein
MSPDEAARMAASIVGYSSGTIIVLEAQPK